MRRSRETFTIRHSSSIFLKLLSKLTGEFSLEGVLQVISQCISYDILHIVVCRSQPVNELFAVRHCCRWCHLCFLFLLGALQRKLSRSPWILLKLCLVWWDVYALTSDDGSCYIYAMVVRAALQKVILTWQYLPIVRHGRVMIAST